MPVCVLSRRSRAARLARQRSHADARADPPDRREHGRRLRHRAHLGRRAPHRLLHVRAAPRSMPLPGLYGPAGRQGRTGRGRHAHRRPSRGARMIVVTTPYLPGHRIVESKGMVFGLVVRSRGLGGNPMAGLRSLGGGEIHEYTSLLEDTRRQALDRLVSNGTLLGANAILSMRFDSSELSGTMSEIVAYGTAVVVAAGEVATSAGPVAE